MLHKIERASRRIGGAEISADLRVAPSPDPGDLSAKLEG